MNSLDYEKQVMVKLFEILNKVDFNWSSEFEHHMKIEMVDLLLEYFTNIEHYEKCGFLKDMKEKLESDDETNSKEA